MANEKRLIDVNRLKGALREVIIEEKQQNNDTTFLSQIGYLLDACPTVDAVEVVRCKDCVHWCYTMDGFGACTNRRFHLDGYADPSMNADDFCSCGERKELG